MRFLFVFWIVNEGFPVCVMFTNRSCLKTRRCNESALFSLQRSSNIIVIFSCDNRIFAIIKLGLIGNGE